MPFGLRVDDGTPYYLPADETERVLVCPQRARRTERITPLYKCLVEEAMYYLDRHTPERLDQIEGHNLAESRDGLAKRTRAIR